MIPDQRERFERFVERKMREAAAAPIERLSTIFDRPDDERVRGIGTAWTRTHYGGDFGLVVRPQDETALSLVFVQSNDGNTGATIPDPSGGVRSTST